MTINDSVRVCIAAQACLLLLHRRTECFPSLRSILVYPNTYIVPAMRHIGSGIMEEFHQTRSGESWQAGAVVLAWDVILNQAQDRGQGHNLVLHEFAHQLDYEDGYADGVPLLAGERSFMERKRRYAAWTGVMRAEFARLQAQVRRGEPTVLRDYGATNPAEFFAVATECFFGKPQAMRREHPGLYEQLKWYYQQDPSLWAVPSALT
jgi:hypothetical protein